MNCPKCGIHVEDGTATCPNCHTLISAPPPPEPQTNFSDSYHNGSKPAEEPQFSQKICPNCGEINPNNAPYCGRCGKSFSMQNPTPPCPPNSGRPVPVEPPRSRLIAAFLALFFGPFGLDEFYLGETGIGVARIVVTVFTWGIGGMIWGVVSALRLLTYKKNTDAYGRPLKDFPF